MKRVQYAGSSISILSYKSLTTVLMTRLGSVRYFLLLFLVWVGIVYSGDYVDSLKSSQDILYRAVEEGQERQQTP